MPRMDGTGPQGKGTGKRNKSGQDRGQGRGLKNQ